MSTGNHGPVSSERAIENLISSYAFLNDDADIAGLGQLFVGAVFTLDETTARGREEIEQRARGNVGRMVRNRCSIPDSKDSQDLKARRPS